LPIRAVVNGLGDHDRSASAHEIRPTIADVEVGRDQVTMSLRIALEPLIAGIDLSAVDDTNDAPEAAIYDQLRALGPEALEAALRRHGRGCRGVC
jgi:hypothetical protein